MIVKFYFVSCELCLDTGNKVKNAGSRRPRRVNNDHDVVVRCICCAPIAIGLVIIVTLHFLASPHGIQTKFTNQQSRNN